MKFPEISKLIKEQRYLREITLYELEEIVGVTASYLSQVENGNKLPSKRVLFLITHFLGIHTGVENNFQEKLIKEYAGVKELNESELWKEYRTFIKEYLDEKMKPMRKWADDWNNNRIQATKNTLDAKRIEKPYFDIKWLLTQKDFEVFFGRDYDIQGTQWQGSDMMDKILFNRLNDEDIKIIHDLIEAYISNRYKKVFSKESN